MWPCLFYLVVIFLTKTYFCVPGRYRATMPQKKNGEENDQHQLRQKRELKFVLRIDFELLKNTVFGN